MKPPKPVTRKPTTTSLVPSSNQKCVAGTKFVRNRGCVDIDECREIEDACSSNEECVNTVGSYTCNCKIGFRRENLTQACVDINECQTQVKTIFMLTFLSSRFCYTLAADLLRSLEIPLQICSHTVYKTCKEELDIAGSTDWEYHWR